MWNNPSTRPIGLLAGQGEFPVLFAKAAKAMERPVIAIGVQGVMDRRVGDFASEAHMVPWGELGRVIEILKTKKIKQVAFAGAVPKKKIYDPSLSLDEAAQSFLKKSPNKGDDHILRAFEIFLKMKCGVSVIDARIFLKDMAAKKGVWTRRAPSSQENKDLKLGFQAAKQVGKMDIGQTVVVKDGVIIAVEGLEGTDAAIRRGAELARGGIVVVKVSKPNQDLRFDLPCVGPETVETLRSVSARVLGVEAGKTIVIHREKLIEAADRAGLSIVGL